MATEKQAAAQAREITLDDIIKETKQTERSRAQEMVEALVGEALKGTMKWEKNVSRTIAQAIRKLDEAVSRQLAAVMHAPEFQKLEGTWRGLHHLVMNSETSEQLQIKVFNVSKRELFKDLDTAAEFDQSQVFKKIYESEFGQPGGHPYGALIGDYDFTNHPEDVDLLSKVSNVAAAAFAPFISAASPKLLGFESWTELSKPRDLEKIFSSPDYTKWRSFRESEDARFVTLTCPRTLARLPYGAATKPVDEFGFEEVDAEREAGHDQYCWMNTAYVLGARLTDSFAKNGWCTAIRGAENGGKVEGLPVHVFTSDDGDRDSKCPTEVAITDRREAELGKLGFLPLSHYKRHDYAVFFGADSVQKPKKYDKAAATANAAIGARLPYIMASSRIAHFLKVIARDKIGSNMEREDVQRWLNDWITTYVLDDPKGSAEMKAKFPLAEAKIEVTEDPRQPGAYHAVAHLRPWLQMEELTTSLRLVARIPKVGG